MAVDFVNHSTYTIHSPTNQIVEECQIEKEFVALWHIEYTIYFNDTTCSPGWQLANHANDCDHLFLIFFTSRTNRHILFANLTKFQDKETNQASASLSLCCFQVKFLSCLSRHSHDCSTVLQLSIYKTKVNDFFLWILICFCISLNIHRVAFKVHGYWILDHEQAYGFLL